MSIDWKIDQLADCCDLRFHTDEDKADLLSHYYFRANGCEFRVSTDLDTDGATIPRSLLGVIGDRYDRLNVFPAIIHDGAYTHNLWVISVPAKWSALHPDFWDWTPVYLEAADADGLFKSVRAHLGGAAAKNWFMWLGIRYNSGIAKKYPTFADFLKKHPDGRKFTDCGVVQA
jgi:hypothetical protein